MQINALPHFDIAIVGGGMVGATLAASLQHSFRVALIDANPNALDQDHRLIALNFSSIELLKKIGVWSQLSSSAELIKSVHVSEARMFGKVTLNASDVNVPYLGAVIPAHILNVTLYAHLQNISLYKPATVSEFKNDILCKLTCNREQHAFEITADLVIAADGTSSALRKLAGIDTTQKDFLQTALVTITHLKRSHHHIAYERFIDGGAIAMLPLQNNRVATIWTASNHTIANLIALSKEDFIKKVQIKFGYRLGRLLKIEERYSYPIKSVITHEVKKNNLLFIGNSAHTLSPIAAQGLNLGFSEIELLTQILKNPLSHTHWDEYVGKQSSQSQFSLNLSNNLMTLFSEENVIGAVFKPLAFLALDLCAPFKNRFIQKAAGL